MLDDTTSRLTRLAILCIGSLITHSLVAQDTKESAELSRFGAGDGLTLADGVYHLLDAAKTPSQSNAIAFDRTEDGRFDRVTLHCQLRVDEGGDGGAFVFLNTTEFGAHGPAPFVKDWTAPNLTKTFAVGIDVHDPPNQEPFGPWGNYQGLPEREISLHWDGREIVKRVAEKEFRGALSAVEIDVVHVIGGSEVTVRIGDGTVYDHYFIAGMLPYESRLAIGAATRADVTTCFDVQAIEFTKSQPSKHLRRPIHVEVFHHVMTDNSKTSFENTVSLPPLEWALGRVILTLDIHDGGDMWDEWDRNGEVSIWDKQGNKLGIVPFITSYRVPCHWLVDVTPFRPLLTGETRFEVSAGTTFYKNRGYAMSVALDFYHGAPKLEPFRVIPLWCGTAHYRSDDNHFQDFFARQSVEIPNDVLAARVFMTTTGHSQVGEFTPSKRTLVFRPNKENAENEQRFDNTLWKTDCYLNPIRPQFGTWKFSRAGWAPGDVVRPWWIDLTPHLAKGSVAEFRYEPQRYDFSDSKEKPTDAQLGEASHVVRSYLILYQGGKDKTPAPVVLVTNVVGGSNAAKAGIQQGDYIASYDARALDSVEDLRNALHAAEEANKKTVQLIVFRGSQRLELELPTGRLGVNLTIR